MDNQPANVRLFVMHGGVETFVELLGSAFQHAHSLSASSSPLPAAGAAVATPAAASGSEEDFGAAGKEGVLEGAGDAKVLATGRRERASDMSVALTCRELVVECISCLSSALEVGCDFLFIFSIDWSSSVERKQRSHLAVVAARDSLILKVTRLQHMQREIRNSFLKINQQN